MPTSNIIGIKGSGAYFPKQRVEVRALAEKYHLNYSSILKDHGIKRIHLAGPSETELFMATKAAQDALEDAGLNAKEIDVIIFCKGITRQRTARSTSSQIIENLKATEAYGFDIEGGLIGGLIGIQVANDIIRNNYYIHNALIVSAQEFDELYLFGGGASRIKNMIFGDGAAALVLSNDASNNKILASDFVIDHYTSFIDELLLENLVKDSQVRKMFQKLKVMAVVKKIKQKQTLSKLTERWVDNSYKVIESCIKSINLDVSDINHFIQTQLSLKETEMLCKKLGISMDRIYNTSAERGHLGPADIIYNLHSTLQNPNLKNLDIIAVVTANYDCSAGAIVIRR
jgi:3-oxoacyl-[acyl-carrier-protein] synthase III